MVLMLYFVSYRWLLLWAGACLLVVPLAHSKEGVLMGLEQVRQLSISEARKGQRVEVEGVVTYADPAWNTFYLQHGDSGILVRHYRTSGTPQRGQKIRVSGTTQEADGYPCVGQGKWEYLEGGQLPEAKPIEIRCLETDPFLWVEISGVVHRARLGENSRMVLTLHDDSEKTSIRFRDALPEGSDPMKYVDSFVRVRGLALPVAPGRPDRDKPLFLVESLTDMVIEQKAPEKPFSQYVQPLSDLPAYSARRILTRGTAGNDVVGRDVLHLQDGNKTVSVSLTSPGYIRRGEHVEVLGFPTWQDERISLCHASYRVLTLSAAGALKNPGEYLESDYLPQLHRLAEIRDLGTEAGRGYPVRLSGTVTNYQSAQQTAFVCDGSTSVRVEGVPPSPEFAIGKDRNRHRRSYVHIFQVLKVNWRHASYKRKAQIERSCIFMLINCRLWVFYVSDDAHTIADVQFSSLFWDV